MARGSGTLVLLVALAGCGNGTRQRDINREYSAAENRLRELYNQGACQSIYEEAAESFRRHESLKDWLARCASTRTRLGAWRNVGGREVFEKGNYRVQMFFGVEGKRSPRLVRLIFEGDGQQWLHLPGRLLVDPPPRPPQPRG